MIKLKDGFHGEQALVLPPFIVEKMKNEAVTSMMYITDIGYYPCAINHYRERTEPIEQYVYIYCIEGAGWYSFSGKKHLVKENQCFILPAREVHAYGADKEKPWSIYWIHFGGRLVEEYLVSYNYKPIMLTPNLHSRIYDRQSLFEDIFFTLKMGYSLENLSYVSAVFHHYLASLFYLKQYRDNRDQEQDLINASIYYMKENIEKKITLLQFANYVGLSTSYFSKLFLERTGYSPVNYFNQIKIQKACQLLDFTDLKVNQISYKLGIEDTYYFSRLFKKIMRISPRVYRKIKKG